MYGRAFFVALTLVAALAQALVYGLGGYYAITGPAVRRHGGHARAAAHPPVRPAHRAVERARGRDERAGQLRPGLRGARPAADDRRQAGRDRAARRTPARIEFDDVYFSYPTASEVSLASLEDVAVLDATPSTEVLHGVSFRAEAGPARRARRPVRCRQDHDQPARPAHLRRALGRGPRRRRGRPRRHAGFAARADRRRQPGSAHVPRHDPREPAVRAPRGLRAAAARRGRGGAARRAGRVAAGRSRHRRRRPRLPAVRRREGPPRDRPAAAQAARHRHPRRGDRAPRQRERGGGAARARRPRSRAARRS